PAVIAVELERSERAPVDHPVADGAGWRQTGAVRGPVGGNDLHRLDDLEQRRLVRSDRLTELVIDRRPGCDAQAVAVDQEQAGASVSEGLEDGGRRHHSITSVS